MQSPALIAKNSRAHTPTRQDKVIYKRLQLSFFLIEWIISVSPYIALLHHST